MATEGPSQCFTGDFFHITSLLWPYGGLGVILKMFDFLQFPGNFNALQCFLPAPFISDHLLQFLCGPEMSGIHAYLKMRNPDSFLLTEDFKLRIQGCKTPALFIQLSVFYMLHNFVSLYLNSTSDMFYDKNLA